MLSRLRSTYRGGLGRAFTLIEVMAVTVVIGVLLAAGASLMPRSVARARGLAVDQLCSSVERARSAAASRRECVLLALRQPSDDAPTAQLALFRVKRGPDEHGVMEVSPLQRWQALPAGVVMATGQNGVFRNLMDMPPWTLHLTERGEVIMAHGVIVNPQGRMLMPAGNDPLVVRLADGGYRHGRIQCDVRHGVVPETQVKIGRAQVRAWRVDP